MPGVSLGVASPLRNGTEEIIDGFFLCQKSPRVTWISSETRTPCSARASRSPGVLLNVFLRS